MNISKKHILALLVMAGLSGSTQAATLNVDNWENSRGQGLIELQHVFTNFMGINAQDVYPVDKQASDYAINRIDTVQVALAHPALSSMVVMNKDGGVLLEHYANGNDAHTTFSAQSSSKSMGYILLGDALKSGKITLQDKVEKYIPEIGPGFRGRTISDIAAMAVNHNGAELAAYSGDEEALKIFKESDAIFGFARNDEQTTLAEFVPQIQVGAGGSNEWKGDTLNYASINTNILVLAIERATGIDASRQIRNLLHKVGPAETVYMLTDFDGIPMLSGGFVSTTVDLARYGRMLIAEPKQVAADQKAAKSSGQVTPALIMGVDSHYYKSAILNQYGLGHSGWGGQVIWGDPVSGTVVAINGQINSEAPAPYDYYNMAYTAIYDIIKHEREKQTAN
jgi:CubicO group peptidase (beta-lactamase class C family)